MIYLVLVHLAFTVIFNKQNLKMQSTRLTTCLDSYYDIYFMNLSNIQDNVVCWDKCTGYMCVYGVW